MARSARSYEARDVAGNVAICTSKRRILKQRLARLPATVARLTVSRCTKRGAVVQTLSRIEQSWVLVGVHATDEGLLTMSEARYRHSLLDRVCGHGLHW